MDERRRVGAAAEAAVERELVRRGWRVIGRNVSVGTHGELDLIARNDREVVFVEVRSRRGGDQEDALDSIGPGKRTRVRRTASAWLQDRPVDYEEARIFVGVVRWHGSEARVEIVEDAF